MPHLVLQLVPHACSFASTSGLRRVCENLTQKAKAAIRASKTISISTETSEEVKFSVLLRGLHKQGRIAGGRSGQHSQWVACLPLECCRHEKNRRKACAPRFLLRYSCSSKAIKRNQQHLQYVSCLRLIPERQNSVHRISTTNGALFVLSYKAGNYLAAQTCYDTKSR